MSAISQLCFALDVADVDSAIALVDELQGHVGVFKIGLELFIVGGPDLVRTVRARGVDVFLDLKLHDIAATVGAAVARAVALDVRFLTIHASGGPAMLRAAAAAAAGSLTTLLAVTALTSLSDDDLAAAGYAENAITLVPRLARLAKDAGIGGIVCSPLEVEAVGRAAPGLLKVTPGIRGANDASNDQVRTMSASDAIRAGADLLVVGRPIRTAVDRTAAADAFVKEIAATRASLSSQNQPEQP